MKVLIALVVAAAAAKLLIQWADAEAAKDPFNKVLETQRARLHGVEQGIDRPIR